MDSAEGIAPMLTEMFDELGALQGIPPVTDALVRDLVESGSKVLERERKAKRKK